MDQTNYDEKMKRVDSMTYHAKMAAMSLPKSGTCIVDDETAIMDREYFEALATYNISLPIGTYFGERWKRNLSIKTTRNAEWIMGEYYALESDKEIGIRWRRIIVVEEKPS